MAEQESSAENTGKDTGSKQPEMIVHITPPQSIMVKNSMPKDGIPPQIADVLKNVGTQNGKEEQ